MDPGAVCFVRILQQMLSPVKQKIGLLPAKYSVLEE